MPKEGTPITWKHYVSPHSREIEVRVTNQSQESASIFDICKQIINIHLLIEITFQQSNLYSQQNGGSLLPMLRKANYIRNVKPISKHKLSSDCNHFVGNVGIQNIFARPRNQAVFRNNRFADNTKQNK